MSDTTSTTSLDLDNEDATRRVGAALGELVARGDVIGLIGDLGAGKTTLCKALIAALGVDEDDVTSPTFVLAREHEGRIPAVHVDCYRMQYAAELTLLDLPIGESVLALIEWADKVTEALPTDHLSLELEHLDGGRKLTIRAGGPRSEELKQGLLARVHSGQSA